MAYKKVSKFQNGSAVYKCVICGKATRDTGTGEKSVDMCARCYLECSLENEHSDGGHTDYYDPNCPTCRAERAEKNSPLTKK